VMVCCLLLVWTSDGTSSWVQQGTLSFGPRIDFTLTIFNGAVYLIGGRAAEAATATPVNEVWKFDGGEMKLDSFCKRKLRMR
jgi:hypothetical protein